MVSVAEAQGLVARQFAKDQEPTIKALADRQVKQNRRSLLTEANESDAAITKSLTALDIEYETRTDYKEYPDEWRLKAEGAIDDVLRGVSDPDVNSEVKKRAFRAYSDRVKYYARKSNVQRIEALDASVVNSLDAYAEAYAFSHANPETLENIRRAVGETIAHAVANGMDAGKAQRILINWGDRAALALIAKRQILDENLPFNTPDAPEGSPQPPSQVRQLTSLLDDLANPRHPDLRSLDPVKRAEVEDEIKAKLYGISSMEDSIYLSKLDIRIDAATAETGPDIRAELIRAFESGKIKESHFLGRSKALTTAMQGNEGDIATIMAITETLAGHSKGDILPLPVEDDDFHRLYPRVIDSMMAAMGESGEMSRSDVKQYALGVVSDLGVVPKTWVAQYRANINSNNPDVVKQAVGELNTIAQLNTPLFAETFDRETRFAVNYYMHRLASSANPSQDIANWQAARAKSGFQESRDYVNYQMNAEATDRWYEKSLKALDEIRHDPHWMPGWGGWGKQDIPQRFKRWFIDGVTQIAYTSQGTEEEMKAAVDTMIEEFKNTMTPSNFFTGDTEPNWTFQPADRYYMGPVMALGISEGQARTEIAGVILRDIGTWLHNHRESDPRWMEQFSDAFHEDVVDDHGRPVIKSERIRLEASPFLLNGEYNVWIRDDKGREMIWTDENGNPVPWTLDAQDIEEMKSEIEEGNADRVSMIEQAAPQVREERRLNVAASRKAAMDGDMRALGYNLLKPEQLSWQSARGQWTFTKYDRALREFVERDQKYADPDGVWFGEMEMSWPTRA